MLANLKAGDEITRYLSSERLPMPLVVKEVSDEFVWCRPPTLDWARDQCWKFDIVTGAEIDEELEWGPAFGATGSFLEL